MTVAKHAGIRCPTGHIFVNKVLDNALLEGVTEVNDMMLKAHLLRIMLRLHDRLNGTAPFLLRQT